MRTNNRVKQTAKLTLITLLTAGLAAVFSPSLAAQQMEQSVACPLDNSVLDLVYGQHTVDCSIDTATDLDRFRLCVDAGDDMRFKVSAPSNFMDPELVVRDPMNAIVAEQSCNDSCAFTMDLVAAKTGCYTLFLSDLNTISTGDYSLQAERYAPSDETETVLAYDQVVDDAIDPVTDTDFYRFYGIAGTEIRLNASALSNFMDPVVEIRRPDSSVIIDGVADNATCNDSCSFSVDVLPDITGWYTLAIYTRNTVSPGSYSMSLWCVVGPCDSDGNGQADPVAPLLSYVTEVDSEIEANLDADFYRINATVGTEIRLIASALSNFMDPTIELRDPNNVLVIDGIADSATCNDSCSFSVNFTPTLEGIHSLIIRDRARISSGSYKLAMWCLYGPCDSDADGAIDGDVRVSYDTPTVLSYGDVAEDIIEPEIDADRFLFGGTAGDLIQIGVTALSNFMDPTLEIRDPNNLLVVDGSVNPDATCNDSCSISFEFEPAVDGNYSLLIRDRAGISPGAYTVSVQCVIGSCTDAVAMCGDNCIDKPNGPLIPDAGGNIQLDVDGDGQGNFCDSDFDNTAVTNFLDISEWADNFLTSNSLYDLNGDGIVNFIDLSLVADMFLMPPGPSCSSPIDIIK